MVKVKEDMTGWKMWEHGVPDSRLTVIEQAEDYVNNKGEHTARWLCECNCSQKNKIIVIGRDLKRGHTKSCGCLHIERTIESTKKYNKYKLNLEDAHGLYGVGYCSNTGREFYFDMDDYDKIKDYCWHEKKQHHGYSSPATKQNIRIHYLISGKYSDHSDRNPFNNRKYNLRAATAQENARNISLSSNNTSGFTGVSTDKRYNKWRAYINVNGKQISLGAFENKEDAVRARLEAEEKYFGEFSPQRNLFEEYGIKV